MLINDLIYEKNFSLAEVAVFKSLFITFLPLTLAAIPSGERVVQGDASISRPSSEQVLVTQNSSKAIVEWDSFSIAAGETAHFKQPDATASILNRVTGGNLSEIYGRIQSNGRVFLINPQGVLVGESGRIDCASFLAAALQIDNQAFSQGRDVQFKGSNGGKIINRGRMSAFGGPLILIGSEIENTGDLEAKDKAVFMITGDEVEIDSFDRPRVMIRPGVASHKSSISPYALAVNGKDASEANYVRKDSGRIFLDTEPFSEEKVAQASPFLTVPGTPAATGVSVERSLDALQQLRTLIPDRLWEEEFALLVDKSGFQDLASELAKHPRLYDSQRSVSGIGSSKYYFLHAAITGEPIRLDDRYLEFLDSPYWKTPEALKRLYYFQHNHGKLNR